MRNKENRFFPEYIKAQMRDRSLLHKEMRNGVKKGIVEVTLC